MQGIKSDPAGAGTSLDLLWPLLELLPDAALVADAAGRIVAANEAAGTLFDFPTGSLVGRQVEAVIPERLRREHRRHRAAFVRSPRRRAMGASLELRGRRADGSEFPVDVSLAPLEGPQGLLVLATVRDQTERQAANELHAQLAAVVRSSPDAIVSVSTDGRVTSWNPGGQRLLGYAEEEITGRHYSLLLPEGVSRPLEDLLGAALAREAAAPLDTVLLRRDGVPVQVSLTVSPLVDLDGRDHGFTLMVRDISVRRAAETEVERALAVERRRQRELQATADIRLHVLDGAPVDATLHLVAALAAQVLEASSSALYLAAGGDLQRRFSHGDGSVGGAEAPGERALAAQVVDGGAGMPFQHTDPARSTVGAPVARSGLAVGALVVSRPAAFDADDRAFVTSLAGQASLAMEVDQARRDQQLLVIAGDRERIARDLHDLVIQRLFANALGLEAVRSAPDRTVRDVDDRLSSVVEGLDETIKEIRTTIFHLQHHQVEGLRAWVLATVHEASSSLGFEPQLSFCGPTETAVPGTLVPAVTAVLREALSNVARHAHADRAHVSVEVGGGELRLTVTDNGRGLGPGSRRSGLANLARRARHLGGDLDLDEPASGGTRLRWRVPLAPPG